MKYLLLIFTFIISFKSLSQITITHLDMPQPGKAYIYEASKAEGLSLSPGPEGPNQFWDFSMLESIISDTISYHTIQNSPYSNFSPYSNLVKKEHWSGDLTYFNNTPEGLALIGSTKTFSNDSLITPFQPPFAYYNFPLSYIENSNIQSTSKTCSKFTINTNKDTVRTCAIYSISNKVDAWGKIKTPKFFLDAIRIAEKTKIIVFEEAKVNGNWVKHMPMAEAGGFEYKWLAKDVGIEIARILYRDSIPNPEKIDGIVWHSVTTDLTSTLGNKIKGEKANLSIYPNPNNGTFTIESKLGETEELKIYSLTGEVVFNYLNPESRKIIETNLPNGFYLIEHRKSNGVGLDIQKLIISR